MIKFIAAIDEKRGIANEQGIPWQGRIPGDNSYYRQKIKGVPVLMGYGLYKELSKPYPESINYVVARQSKKLRPGFEIVTDARKFLQTIEGDVWNLGGAILYESTFDLADELYITQLQGDFGCTKFFPNFADEFDCFTQSPQRTENGITYCFEVWKRKTKINQP